MLLGLLFDDEAFEAPGLIGPEELFRLRIPPTLNQLVLPLKDSLSQVPLFKNSERTMNGFEMSKTKAMPSGSLRTCFTKWGQITGFELPLKPYAFRRGNGEALDSSGKLDLTEQADIRLMTALSSHQRCSTQRDIATR